MTNPGKDYPELGTETWSGFHVDSYIEGPFPNLEIGDDFEYEAWGGFDTIDIDESWDTTWEGKEVLRRGTYLKPPISDEAKDTFIASCFFGSEFVPDEEDDDPDDDPDLGDPIIVE